MKKLLLGFLLISGTLLGQESEKSFGMLGGVTDLWTVDRSTNTNEFRSLTNLGFQYSLRKSTKWDLAFTGLTGFKGGDKWDSKFLTGSAALRSFVLNANKKHKVNPFYQVGAEGMIRKDVGFQGYAYELHALGGIGIDVPVYQNFSLLAQTNLSIPMVQINESEFNIAKTRGLNTTVSVGVVYHFNYLGPKKKAAKEAAIAKRKAFVRDSVNTVREKVQAEENIRLAKIAAEKKIQDDLKAKEEAILKAKAEAEAAIAKAKAEAEAEILKLKAEAQALAQKNEEEKAAAAPVVKARKKLPLAEQIKKEKEAIPMEAAPILKENTATAPAEKPQAQASAPADKPVVKEVVAPKEKEKKPVVISDDAFSETIILYISNSGQLMPETKGKLNRIISNMKARPEVKIKVEGHSDNEGTFRNNLKVSRIRAMKVLRYLYRYGIPERRIIAIAHGETRPAATNKTPEGRKLNRRVEISIVK
jgi:outer membrane protein OmpA-like peptidoglycan-associated protein